VLFKNVHYLIASIHLTLLADAKICVKRVFYVRKSFSWRGRGQVTGQGGTESVDLRIVGVVSFSCLGANGRGGGIFSFIESAQVNFSTSGEVNFHPSGGLIVDLTTFKVDVVRLH